MDQRRTKGGSGEYILEPKESGKRSRGRERDHNIDYKMRTTRSHVEGKGSY